MCYEGVSMTIRQTLTDLKEPSKIAGLMGVSVYCAMLTRARRGDRFFPNFPDSSKTSADVGAKLLVTTPASIWRLLSKYQKIRLLIFEKIAFRLTSSFATSGQKRQMLESC